MTKIFKKYKYDIALEEGVGAHLVTWVTGLMVFFMTLMLAANVGLAELTKNWVTGLSGSLTVEIQPPVSADGKVAPEQQKAFTDSVQKILWMAQQHPAVAEARALSKDEITALISPWLGEKMTDDIALPALIDLKLNPDADTAKLQSDIRGLVPSATIDTHDETLDDVRTVVNTARAFVLLLTSVITLLAVVAISGIVSSKFSIHKGEAEILHLLGASDEYVAEQFRRHTLQGTLKGAIVGVGCMIFTLLVIGYVTHAVDAAILPHLRLSPASWAMLIFAPILIGTAIAHMTAQVTVMRALARFP